MDTSMCLLLPFLLVIAETMQLSFPQQRALCWCKGSSRECAAATAMGKPQGWSGGEIRAVRPIAECHQVHTGCGANPWCGSLPTCCDLRICYFMTY